MRHPPTPAGGTVNVNSQAMRSPHEAQRNAGSSAGRKPRISLRCIRATKARSEWIPRRFRRELQVSDVGAEAQADPRADRDDDNTVRGEGRHADAADEIGRAVDPTEALVDRARRR